MPAPDLEDHFLEPPGWQWDSFTLNDEHTVRFGHVAPEDPEAIIVCLPGLAEFGEKYFETARDALAQNMAFWVVDWPSQGKSSPVVEGLNKRHSLGYELELSILNELFKNHVEPSNEKGVVCALLAHSMGGHIGLRYLNDYPWVFQCAGFSAPMFGLKSLRLPWPIPQLITKLGEMFFATSYAPGQKDWSADLRDLEKNKIYSNDMHREKIHNAWCQIDSDLQTNGVTWGWIRESLKSCALIQKKKFISFIQIPCLVATAGQEKLVDNKAIHKAVKYLPNATHVHYDDALHELLVETDDVRNDFLSKFFEMVKNTEAP